MRGRFLWHLLDSESPESVSPGAIIMTPENRGTSSDADRLRDLAYLASAVGHHVINGFSAAVSNAELIRSPAGVRMNPSELAELGNGIVETSLDASQVARKLIDWARQVTAIDVDPNSRTAQFVDLNQLIEDLVEAERRSSGSAIEWIVKSSPIPAIRGDALLLRAMLAYVALNAREALPQGSGMVEFSTFLDARNFAVITVRDSGRGMSPDVLRRATEPFFSTKPDRAGIGLTIAQGIWRRHLGMLAIESRPGEGTTIRFSIGPYPPARPTGAEDRSIPQAEPRSPARSPVAPPAT